MGSVVTAAVSSVPCARYTCCNMLFSFRPNTTDKVTFDGVWVMPLCARGMHAPTTQVFQRKQLHSVLERLKGKRVEYILVRVTILFYGKQ